MDRRHGEIVGGLGTAGATIGAVLVFLGLVGLYDDEVLFAGALLVIAGLLLRIEAAVSRGGRTGPGL
ncbi:hypothetical protein M8C17_16735 [Micromonospora sp. RHAY321]|uniref:hypothetical protein n=1 Tax=Micromonospora sp. RHAY321 TaxID=2944807 RepID=UPI00207D1824|nr:hypothetical protein [Micromonospora sp. RHAY321]MCO1596803.1 hypothetical protein [Micromonospora sp. RHAY321]